MDRFDDVELFDPIKWLGVIVEAYCDLKNIKVSTVSNHFFHNGIRLQKILDGKSDIGVRNLNKIVCDLSKNWPENKPKPAQLILWETQINKAQADVGAENA